MLGLEIGKDTCICSERADDILVCVTDSTYSSLCKYFMFLVITSANTLTVYGQE